MSFGEKHGEAFTEPSQAGTNLLWIGVAFLILSGVIFASVRFGEKLERDKPHKLTRLIPVDSVSMSLVLEVDSRVVTGITLPLYENKAQVDSHMVQLQELVDVYFER
jgi:hypothetical protein